ncbi:MAG: DinB family protein [Candidatus Krumholzibacteria bacterium]|nr:DinB family protein [Candidatus Krumholzibacteria bacterium]
MDAKTFQKIARTQFRYTAWVVAGNLKDLTDEQGLAQPAAGNNLNWVAGHVANYRGSTLRLLGQDCPFAADKYDRYERGNPALINPGEAVPLTEILADFMATEEGLQAGLAGLTTEALAAKAPFSPSDNPAETVGTLLAGLVFHEGYHAGQLGLLRRLAGAEGVVK